VKDLINRFFTRNRSKEQAKQRLKFLLIHDQVDLTPAQLNAMKEEIIEVIQKYVEIDINASEIKLERADDTIALVSSVPVQRVVARPALG